MPSCNFIVIPLENFSSGKVYFPSFPYGKWKEEIEVFRGPNRGLIPIRRFVDVQNENKQNQNKIKKQQLGQK